MSTFKIITEEDCNFRQAHHCVVQAGLEFTVIYLSQPLHYGDYGMSCRARLYDYLYNN